MNKLNNLTLLSSSKFVPAILAVADKLAAIVSYPCRTRIGTLAVQLKDIDHLGVPGDGQRSLLRKDKHKKQWNGSTYERDYCSEFVIPANRLNRKTRRNAVRKVSTNKPQVITVKA